MTELTYKPWRGHGRRSGRRHDATPTVTSNAIVTGIIGCWTATTTTTAVAAAAAVTLPQRQITNCGRRLNALREDEAVRSSGGGFST